MKDGRADSAKVVRILSVRRVFRPLKRVVREACVWSHARSLPVVPTKPLSTRGESLEPPERHATAAEIGGERADIVADGMPVPVSDVLAISPSSNQDLE